MDDDGQQVIPGAVQAKVPNLPGPFGLRPRMLALAMRSWGTPTHWKPGSISTTAWPGVWTKRSKRGRTCQLRWKMRGRLRLREGSFRPGVWVALNISGAHG